MTRPGVRFPSAPPHKRPSPPEDIIQYFERFLAWRYVWSSRKDSFVSLISLFSFLGIALGVATLIVVMAVMNGFRYELMDRIVGFNSPLSISVPADPSFVLPSPPPKPISAWVPVIDKQVMIKTPHQLTGAVVRCMSPRDIEHKKLLANHIVKGCLPNTDKGWVMLGHRLAENLGVSVGSVVELMAPETLPTAFGPMPKAQHFQVVGVFDCGMHEYDSTFALMSLTDGLSFFDITRPTTYEVALQDPHTPLPNALAVLHSIPRIHVHDWRESNSHFFQAIQVQSHVMFLILTLIIIVAAFNIVCCLIMLVKDKTKEIAILRTLGASRASILRLFTMAGLWIGGAGTAAGGTMGLLVAYYVEPIRRFLEHLSGTSLFQSEFYFLSTLPFRIVPGEVFAVIGFALLCSLVAALYPAWRASRLSVVKGLRYD